jgi:hypothetical protein
MPSISGIVPSGVYLGRSVEITVSGFGTKWDSSTTVDFGSGVTVTKVIAASATALLVEATIAADAVVGMRDVTVTSASTMEVYKGAFHIDSPIRVVMTGAVEQGGLFSMALHLLDTTTPFDTTQTGDGFFTPLAYPNLAVATGNTGVTLSVSSVSAFEVDIFGEVDVQAPATSASLTITSGPMGATIVSPAPNFSVMARAATPIMAGASSNATLSGALDSALYSVAAPDSPTLFQVALTPGTAPDPGVAVLPASGKWSGLVTNGAGTPSPVVFIGRPQAPVSLVVFAGTAGGTVKTALTATMAGASGPEDTMATTSGKAQVMMALPFIMLDGATTSATYQHWLKYTAVAGDVGKKLHVRTLAGDPQTDTVVDVFGPDAMTSLGGPSDDLGFHEDFTSSAITAAGDQFVEITWSSASMWTAAQSHYDLVVTLE